MQGPHLYEYAVIRVVPRVEREEFVNVGVVLYCRPLRYLGVLIEARPQSWQMLFPDIDCTEVEQYLTAFAQIAEGCAASSPIAALPVAERFRWLTATRSTVIQTSRVHPGLTADPADTLQSLFRKLVL